MPCMHNYKFMLVLVLWCFSSDTNVICALKPGEATLRRECEATHRGELAFKL